MSRPQANVQFSPGINQRFGQNPFVFGFGFAPQAPGGQFGGQGFGGFGGFGAQQGPQQQAPQQSNPKFPA